MKRRYIIFGLVVIIVFSLSVTIVKKRVNEKASLAKPTQYLLSVGTALVHKGSLDVTKHYLASVEAYTRSDVSSRISGNILSITKREGDPVKVGETLVTIDDRELLDKAGAARAEYLATRQKVAGAESAYATQKSIFERDKMLYKEGAISQESLERSQSAYDGAEATLKAFQETLKGLEQNASAAQMQAAYAKIRAPFAGIITRRLSEPGDLVVPGKSILTLEQISPCRIIAQIPPEETNKIKKGTKVYLRNSEQVIAAPVSRIYPSLGRNLLGSIEIQLQAPPFGLPSGSTIGIELVQANVSGLIIPENALAKGDNGAFVYRIRNNLINIKQVKVLGISDHQAVVSGDIMEGDTVATGQENMLLHLKDGSRVSPAGGAQ